MLAPVAEHVRERMPHLARCSNHHCVIPIREYCPSPAGKRGIDVARRRYLKALQAFCERGFVTRFDDQMHVCSLNAQLDDPEVRAPRGDQCSFANREEDRAAAQIADAGRGA